MLRNAYCHVMADKVQDRAVTAPEFFELISQAANGLPFAERARRVGGICGKCGRELGPSEPVWLYRAYYQGILPVTSHCESCAPRWGDPEIADSPPIHYREYSCASCGRRVFKETKARQPTRHMLCSERCSWRWHNAERDRQSAAMRQRICPVCGHGFVGARQDAVTCKPACRQKAYRQRAALGHTLAPTNP
jgi:hypothetical protein